MLFYAQQVRRIPGTGQHEALLDVAAIEAHDELRQRFARNAPLRSRRDSASMVRLTYPTHDGHGMQEGSWYDVPLNELPAGEYAEVPLSSAGSAFLRATLALPPQGPALTHFLSAPRPAPLPTGLPTLAALPANIPALRLDVVDCGHGNWNELHLPGIRLLYDVGACRSYTRAQVRALVRRQKLWNTPDALHVYISHWDVDHYQALLRFTHRELARIQCMYVPDQVPNTATYQSVHARLTKAGVALTAIAPAPRTPGSATIDLHHIGTTGPLRVFRATPGRSRNQTGIALGVVGPTQNALLTGDHHYEKLLAAAGPVLGGAKPLILVTPHHGGHAGTPCAAAWNAAFPTMRTPISCGTNAWGHPFGYVETELRTMQGSAPARTHMAGTLTYQL